MPLRVLVLADPRDPRVRRLPEAAPGVEFAVGERAEDFDGAADAEAVLVWWKGAELLGQVLERAPRVRWVHSVAAGVDRLTSPALAAHPAALTNSRGVFSGALGEFALAAMLFFAKDLRRMLRAQAEGRWDPFAVEVLRGRRVGIAGYGDIGRAVATLARAARMEVLAHRRRPELSRGDPLVSRLVPDLRELMAASDYLVVAAPLTPATRRFIGEAELSCMHDRAVLINLGRGALIDEPALVRALREGRIRGAALDVFEVEPLPEGHPFFAMENVLVSPHCADRTATWLDEALALYLENLRRFRAGEPLLNPVDKTLGY